jgi:glycolate oxidase FAD binding subunit
VTASFEPASVEEAGELLSRLSREKQRSLFVGSGTKLRPGAPVEALVRTARLSRIIEYEPSDQVVSVEAGITLAALQKELAKNRQRLSLDPPFAGRASVGGIVATASSGPRRMRYGGVRDLILGVTLVRADGALAHGGGRVVKNVAGFDLPKLMCGSLGTLGLIAAATFRLHPMPESQATLVARSLPTEGVPDILYKIREAQIEPAAMLATRTGPGRWDVAVLFEGFEAGVRQQQDKMRKIAPVEPGEPWADHARDRETGEVRIKVAALPTALAGVEAALFSALPDARVAWYPALGLGYASTNSVQIAPALESARRSFAVVVEAGPESLDPWGPPPPSLRLHQAVKARFDPEGLLAPGRFVGGI